MARIHFSGVVGIPTRFFVLLYTNILLVPGFGIMRARSLPGAWKQLSLLGRLRK
ncbi:hypothetical protein BJX76DRAFT_319753 [Aspergillus varians]